MRLAGGMEFADRRLDCCSDHAVVPDESPSSGADSQSTAPDGA